MEIMTPLYVQDFMTGFYSFNSASVDSTSRRVCLRRNSPRRLPGVSCVRSRDLSVFRARTATLHAILCGVSFLITKAYQNRGLIKDLSKMRPTRDGWNLNPHPISRRLGRVGEARARRRRSGGRGRQCETISIEPIERTERTNGTIERNDRTNERPRRFVRCVVDSRRRRRRESILDSTPPVVVAGKSWD